MVLSPLFFISYELAKKGILPRDFYSFGKGFVVYPVSMLVVYLVKDLLPIHYKFINVILNVFILKYFIPQFIVIGFFLLFFRRDYILGIGDWARRNAVVFVGGFFFFDAIINFSLEYNRHDPFILFAFPVVRVLMILLISFMLSFVRYREVKLKFLIVFLYFLSLVVLSVPESLYYMSFYFYSFLLTGIFFVIIVALSLFEVKIDSIF